MKRPFALSVFIVFITMAFSVCLTARVNLTLSIMVTVLGIVAIFIQPESRRSIVMILLPTAVGFLVMSYQQANIQDITECLGSQTATITGEITDIPRRQYGRQIYVVQTDSIDIPHAPQYVKLRLTGRTSLEAQEGDRLIATVTFTRTDDAVGYDRQTALFADGIRARAWYSSYGEYTVIKGDRKIRYLPLTLRRCIVAAIHRALPERSAGMLCAMLLGDTDEMDSAAVDNFRATGIAHLLAVSGLHMSLLTCTLAELLQKLKCPPRLKHGITMLFVMLFMAVTGFSPSVTRAGCMHLMALTAKLLRRDTDGFNSLAVGVLAMLLLNPMSAADIGLQMSVASTLALTCFGSKCKDRLSERLPLKDCRYRAVVKARSVLIESLAAPLIAATAILPLSVLHFGRVSLISPLTNLLCLYAATVFILIGILATLLDSIPLIGFLLAFPLKLTAALLCAYLERTTDLLAHLPLSSVNASYSYLPCVLLFSCAMLAAAFLSARNVKTRRFHRHAVCCAFCGISFLLLAAMLSYTLTDFGAQVTIFDMQDGGVCVCAMNRNRAVFAEAGGDSYDWQTVRDALSARGIQKVDALAVSQKSDLRDSLADSLITEYSPDYFFCEGDIAQFPFAQKAAAQVGTAIQPFGGAVKLRSPPLSLEMYTDRDQNRWQRLCCGELTVLVCPESGDCADLPGDWLHCDITVIGSPPANLTRLHTGAVVITAEFREAAQTAYRLHVKGFRHIYITDRDGTLTCAMIDGNLRIQSAR